MTSCKLLLIHTFINPLHYSHSEFAFFFFSVFYLAWQVYDALFFHQLLSSTSLFNSSYDLLITSLSCFFYTPHYKLLLPLPGGIAIRPVCWLVRLLVRLSASSHPATAMTGWRECSRQAALHAGGFHTLRVLLLVFKLL